MPSSIVFGSYRSIADALATALRDSVREGERIEVIVPTRSAADATLSRLEDALPTTQLEIHSLETLARRIVNGSGRFPRLASDQERQLAIELASREVDPELAATPGMTSMLLRSERDVRDSGILLSELRYRIGSTVRLTVQDRLRAAERIWSTAALTLRDSGATTMPDLLGDAIDLVRKGESLPSQIIFGFYDATGLQRMFLDALFDAGRVNAIYVPVSLDRNGEPRSELAFARTFVEWAKRKADVEDVLEDDSAPEWSIAAYVSPVRELHEVCRSVRTLLDEGISPREIAIVARSVDPSEAALLSTMARRFEFGLRGPLGRPLSGNRIARGVVDLLLLQDRKFLRRDVMEIVRSGARLPDIDGQLPSLDQLESATRKAQIARGRRDMVLAAEKRARYREDEPDDTLLRYANLVDALDRRTTGFGSNRTGAAWSRSLVELVEMFRIETEEDLAATEALRELARSLRRGGFAARRFDAKTLAHLIESAESLPAPTPMEPSIWFGDVMRFRGLDVRHLFAIRMQHDAIPQRRIEDALIPDIDRRSVGVRQVGDGRDEEALLFSLLGSSATDVIHFSFASSDSIGRTLRPSSFVKDFIIARRPDERLEILQNLSTWLATAPHPPAGVRSVRENDGDALLNEASPSLLRTLQLHSMKGSDSPFDGRITPNDAFRSRLEKVFSRISPSRLEHLGECPQRFFVTSILGLKEAEDPEPSVQIEIRQKGLIDHEILEELYSSLTDDDWSEIESGDQVKLSTPLRERLTAIVEKRFRAFDAEFPPLNDTIRTIERDETAAVLTRFAASDLAELAGSGFRPAEFELLVDVNASDEARVRLGPIDAGIHGRIDRVDRDSDGVVRVIDYKAGKAFRQTKLESRIEEGLRLQLAIYALVVRRLWDLDSDNVTASIRPLRVDAADADTYAFRLADLHERLTAMLDTLANAIWSGRFPAVPFKDVCNYCIIRDWCRTRNDPREAAQAKRDGSAVRHLEAEES